MSNGTICHYCEKNYADTKLTEKDKNISRDYPVCINCLKKELDRNLQNIRVKSITIEY